MTMDPSRQATVLLQGGLAVEFRIQHPETFRSLKTLFDAY